jgi:hypothetical protein
LWMNVIDSSPTRTASEGHATVGKNPETVRHHHIIKCIQAISFNP